MNELRILIEDLRGHNEKHGCTALDIIAFCDKADTHFPPKEFGVKIDSAKDRELSDAAIRAAHETEESE